MSSYSMLLIFNLNTYLSYSISAQLKLIIYILVFVTTFVMPVLFTLFLVQKGIISSLEMEKKEERKFPFIITSFFYFIVFYLLFQLPVPKFLPLAILGGAFITLLAFFITMKWKISMHTMGLGGIIGLT